MTQPQSGTSHTARRRSPLRRLRRQGPWLATAAFVFAAASSGALAASLRTVIAFDPAARETPENLAIAPDGTTYVSLAFASEIRRIARDGSQRSLTLPTMGGITVGVAIDEHHGGDLDVAVRSSDPSAAGIWRIPRASFTHPVRIAPLPPGSFPNGITFDSHGNLYIADSNLGRIWRLARGAAHATVWSAGPMLAPTGEKFMNFALPGANGIKVHRHVVYVSNTSTQNILTIPITRDGNAGKITVRFRHIEADDFAFAANGDLYIAENPLSRLVRVTPDGHVATLATKREGLDNPSAVAFGTRPGQRKTLYITNSAYFGTHPSLQDTPTDTVGQPLP